MEDLVQLRVKLDRTQADIKKGVGHLTEQRALITRKRGQSEDVTQSQELLATLKIPNWPMFNTATD
jgi:hypothetical protein